MSLTYQVVFLRFFIFNYCHTVVRSCAVRGFVYSSGKDLAIIFWIKRDKATPYLLFHSINFVLH